MITSLPLASPDRVIPRVIAGPLSPLILVGVLLDKVAVPPLNAREKSLTASVPVVLLLANTVSLNVTTTPSLNGAMAVDAITGAATSFKYTLFNSVLDVSCVVLAAFPCASYTELAFTVTLKCSFPVALPLIPIPNV